MNFADTPPPSYTLDALYASLSPLRSRLSEVYAAAVSAWAPESSKGAWTSALGQASNLLTHASIEGELGQRLAMGDVTVAQWRNTVNSAADLVESVGREIGMGSYSIRRLWNEVVVPTAQQAVQQAGDALQTTVSWAPWVIGGLVVLYVLSAGQGLRRALNPFGAAPRRRRLARR